MKKLLVTILCALPILGFGQIKVTEAAGELIKNDPTKKYEAFVIEYDNGGTPKQLPGRLPEPDHSIMGIDSGKTYGKIKFHNKIEKEGKLLFENASAGLSKEVFYCAKEKKYVLDQDLCGEGEKKNEPIAYPTFLDKGKESSFENPKRGNRYLLINTIPNSDLRLYKDKNGKEEKANALRNGRSVSVLIDYYQFRDLESVSLSLNGKDYTYDKSVQDLLDMLKKAESSSVNDTDDGNASTVSSQGSASSQDWIGPYLDAIYDAWKSHTILDIQDLLALQAFQKKLRDQWDFTKLKEEDRKKFIQVVNWHPQQVSLSPIALTFEEADEVEIEMAVKTAGSATATQHKLGNYRTTGGLGISVGNQIFVTGLKNNPVYTDSVLIDSTNQLRAFMDDQNQTSIGIGVNAELYWRTGSWFEPTLNLGFFVPFEEDITPFIGLAPGFRIGNGNVKFSGSFGLALGSVNEIKPEYRDTDLTRFGGLTNDKLAHKVWKSSWVVGFGISFNLK